MNAAIKAAALVAVLAMVLGAVVVSDGSDAAEQTIGDFTYDLTGTGNNRQAEVLEYNGDDTEVEIPSTVRYGSGGSAQEYTVKEIAAGAFSGNTTVTSVKIPESVTSISVSAFDGCTTLTEIAVDEGNANYQSVDGVLYSKSASNLSLLVYPTARAGALELPDNTTTIANGALQGSAVGSVVFNDTFSSSSIRSDMFEGCASLTSVTLPGSYTGGSQFPLGGLASLTTVVWNGAEGRTYTVPASAFEGCASLTSVTLPDGTRTIGAEAFSGCARLAALNIPASVQTIGAGAFSGTALGSVTIPADVTSLPDSVFEGCTSLATVAFAEGCELTSIGDRAFAGSALASFTVQASVTSVGDGAFDDCASLTSITVAEGNTAYASVGGILFSADMDTLVKYPAMLTATEYVVPEGVAIVSQEAFSLAKNLTTVEMPSSVTSIGDRAFQGCSALRTVAIASGSLTVGAQAFDIQPEEPATLQVFTDAPQFGDAAFGSDVTPEFREYKNYGIRDSDELMGDALIWIVVAIVLGVIFLAASLRARAN